MTMKREPSISEQQAREIVERMGRRESRSEKSMDDFYRNIGLNPEQLAQPGKTVTKKRKQRRWMNRQAKHPKKWQCHRSVSAATTQAVAGRVPYHLPASTQDNRP